MRGVNSEQPSVTLTAHFRFYWGSRCSIFSFPYFVCVVHCFSNFVISPIVLCNLQFTSCVLYLSFLNLPNTTFHVQPYNISDILFDVTISSKSKINKEIFFVSSTGKRPCVHFLSCKFTDTTFHVQPYNISDILFDVTISSKRKINKEIFFVSSTGKRPCVHFLSCKFTDTTFHIQPYNISDILFDVTISSKSKINKEIFFVSSTGKRPCVHFLSCKFTDTTCHIQPYNISDILLDLAIKHPSVKRINKKKIFFAQLAKGRVSYLNHLTSVCPSVVCSTS